MAIDNTVFQHFKGDPFLHIKGDDAWISVCQHYDSMKTNSGHYVKVPKKDIKIREQMMEQFGIYSSHGICDKCLIDMTEQAKNQGYIQ